MNGADWWAAARDAEREYRAAAQALEQRRQALGAILAEGVASRHVSEQRAAAWLGISRGTLRRWIGKRA